MAELYGRYELKNREGVETHTYVLHGEGWTLSWAKRAHEVIVRRNWGSDLIATIPADAGAWSEEEFESMINEWADSEQYRQLRAGVQ